ncbi:hypothetical protein AALP_AA7G164800 [Arabis alpina]|uniref:MD-2-related lipid-recognition domain-containing protein n=1 Tax=Arabis alpina TaxID=50452 RepID=A0A087GIH8_ARAAL|nr:hypothetical protein AALP_AA7G164800 [Arabis alpina]
MAMSYVQPLLFLLASFFFLRAFRAHEIDVDTCSGTSFPYGYINSVDVSEEFNSVGSGTKDIDTVMVRVFGYTSIKRSNWGLVEVFRKIDNKDSLLKSYNPCELISCPVKPDTYFTFHLSKVPYTTPGKYVVRLLDSGEERSTVFCVEFDMSLKAPALVSA